MYRPQNQRIPEWLTYLDSEAQDDQNENQYHMVSFILSKFFSWAPLSAKLA